MNFLFIEYSDKLPFSLFFPGCDSYLEDRGTRYKSKSFRRSVRSSVGSSLLVVLIHDALLTSIQQKPFVQETAPESLFQSAGHKAPKGCYNVLGNWNIRPLGWLSAFFSRQLELENFRCIHLFEMKIELTSYSDLSHFLSVDGYGS